MFTVYYANQLEYQKELLIRLLEVDPLDDPFAENIILVQSPGMAQWLQIQLADHFGIAANFSFPMPSTFIWRLYKESIPTAGEKNIFSKENLVWRLMRIIPQLLDLAEFSSLRHYLGEQFTPLKLFQLAEKIADLFDQYLVYRPNWIQQWESGQQQRLQQQVAQQVSPRYQTILATIMQDLSWQAILWQQLINDMKQTRQQDVIWHRAGLYYQYLDLLAQGHRPKHLPKRICIFGISALPPMFLSVLSALREHTDIHLFFNSPSRYYWGDIIDHRYLEKLKLKQLKQHQDSRPVKTIYDESLSVGHSLLASWGKLGRDFLYTLTQLAPHDIECYLEPNGDSLLQQIQRSILDLTDSQNSPQKLDYHAADNSLSFHACHSPMREIEVLHDNLLAMFTQDPSLTPKDIVVMVANIDRYTPYIQAVFSQYRAEDKRHIPFAISDRKITESDIVVATFLQFFSLKEALFSLEMVLSLLEVACIRQRFSIASEELSQIREWATQSGIRFGLYKNHDDTPNYNAWQNGIDRMLLGYALKNEYGVWQDNVGFDYSEGLQAKIAGKLAHFIEALQQWDRQLQQALTPEQWRAAILTLIATFFEVTDSSAVVAMLKQAVHYIVDTALENGYQQTLSAEVIHELLQAKLNEQENSVHFLMGQLNFCTLLPMRAIPFKVICLLGMNEGDFPRQFAPNSFDIMQYQPQKGDRVRREDDRYLFLEALLSARERLYISYVGYSAVNNTAYPPSVLVSQLMDYLRENLSQPSDIERLKFSYPATIFSVNNFVAPHFSYAKEWADVAELQQATKQIEPFISELATTTANHTVTVIALDELIRFVVAPQRYFFEQKLGVVLNHYHQAVEENETFVLDNLAQYQLKTRLLQYDHHHWHEEFEKAKREGLLPRAGFTFLQQNALEETCAALWNEITAYQTVLPTSLKIDICSNIDGKTVLLQGQIDHLYQGQYVNWRAGKIRDQEQIILWLNHLLLQLKGEKQSSIFFGLQSGEVTQLGFTPLSSEEALTQLNIYIRDFLQAQQQICLIPTVELTQFSQLFADEQNDEEALRYKLNQIDDQDRQYPYWQRLLLQSPSLDYAQIKTKFSDWFEKMLAQITESK